MAMLNNTTINGSLLVNGDIIFHGSPLNIATNTISGLVKIGYGENGKNYPVELNSDGQMFVNVPWSDTVITDYVTKTTEQTITGKKIFKNSNGIEIQSGTNTTGWIQNIDASGNLVFIHN